MIWISQLIKILCLEEWLCGNNLSLNTVKTQAMMIGSKHKLSSCNRPKDTEVSLKINADDVKWVCSTKYLGVHIDENLAWDKQIKAIKLKVSRGIGWLKYELCWKVP